MQERERRHRTRTFFEDALVPRVVKKFENNEEITQEWLTDQLSLRPNLRYDDFDVVATHKYLEAQLRAHDAARHAIKPDTDRAIITLYRLFSKISDIPPETLQRVDASWMEIVQGWPPEKQYWQNE